MSPPLIRMHRLNADLILLFAAALWGTAFLFQKSATEHLEPLTFIAARCCVAALALAPLARREWRNAAAPAPPGFLAIVVWGGLAFFIAAWFQQTGIETATVTNTGFLTALYVVITPFAAWVLSGKVPGVLVWPAVVLSAFGTLLLGGGSLGSLSLGDELVAVSAVFWAGHVAITGLAASFGRPIAFTALQLGLVAALAAVGAALLETPSASALAAAAVDIGYVGLLSTALTFTLLTVAMQHTPPSEAAVIVSTETVFAALAAYLILGERLTGLGWAGAALILLAILLVQLGPALGARRQRSRGPA